MEMYYLLKKDYLLEEVLRQDQIGVTHMEAMVLKIKSIDSIKLAMTNHMLLMEPNGSKDIEKMVQKLKSHNNRKEMVINENNQIKTKDSHKDSHNLIITVIIIMRHKANNRKVYSQVIGATIINQMAYIIMVYWIFQTEMEMDSNLKDNLKTPNPIIMDRMRTTINHNSKGNRQAQIIIIKDRTTNSNSRVSQQALNTIIMDRIIINRNLSNNQEVSNLTIMETIINSNSKDNHQAHNTIIKDRMVTTIHSFKDNQPVPNIIIKDRMVTTTNSNFKGNPLELRITIMVTITNPNFKGNQLDHNTIIIKIMAVIIGKIKDKVDNITMRTISKINRIDGTSSLRNKHNNNQKRQQKTQMM
mmetsp:Transcript_45364/g.40652  ORF Transcript_45364/g.40652 Transcript_45364/m.40652 type:complete len:358 (-) Transcript_45364:415-1488(-)